MDDQRIISHNKELIRIFKGELKAWIGINDLGVLLYTLGLEGESTESLVLVSHEKYTRTLVDRFA